MRTSILAELVAVCTAAAVPAMAQQQSVPGPDQQMQRDADKGAKTRNSGESGYVADQDKPGAAAHPPGRPEGQTTGSSSEPSGSTTPRTGDKPR